MLVTQFKRCTQPTSITMGHDSKVLFSGWNVAGAKDFKLMKRLGEGEIGKFYLMGLIRYGARFAVKVRDKALIAAND